MREYTQLQQLYDAYESQGLRILAFPANDFDNQEPGSNEDIFEYATKEFGVTFDMMAKTQG